MKADIHPKYFDTVEIRCSCGNVIIAGSTREKLKTELCSKCHPFYTGQQKLVDTAGRVDRFAEKLKKSAKLQEEAVSRADFKKKKPEAYVEKEIPEEVIARATGVAAKEHKGKWETPIGDAPAIEVAKEEIAEAKKAKAAKAAAKKTPAKKSVAKPKTPSKKVAVKKKSAKK